MGEVTTEVEDADPGVSAGPPAVEWEEAPRAVLKGDAWCAWCAS